MNKKHLTVCEQAQFYAEKSILPWLEHTLSLAWCRNKSINVVMVRYRKWQSSLIHYFTNQLGERHKQLSLKSWTVKKVQSEAKKRDNLICMLSSFIRIINVHQSSFPNDFEWRKRKSIDQSFIDNDCHWFSYANTQ